MSKKAICYAQGLPLALHVLGPFLKHRNLDAWESTLDRLKETPPKKVLDTLRISFDSLEETEKKILDRKSTRLNSSHDELSRMPSSA